MANKKKEEIIKDEIEANKLVEKLIKREPTISVDKLVKLTGKSEYIVLRIYMKLRRRLMARSSL